MCTFVCIHTSETMYFNKYLLSNYFVPETVLSIRVAKKRKVTGPAVRVIHSLGKKSNLKTDTLPLARLG